MGRAHIAAREPVQREGQLKVAIITSALPAKVQDYISSQPDKDPGYLAAREMILNFVARVADSGPSAMDIGGVQQQQWQEQQYGGQRGPYQKEQWQTDQWMAMSPDQMGMGSSDFQLGSSFDEWAAAAGFGEVDVNAVQDHSQSICYNCNQKGHISPQRPKGKGKGKNNKGKGNGGKGFQGKGYGQFQPK